MGRLHTASGGSRSLSARVAIRGVGRQSAQLVILPRLLLLLMITLPRVTTVMRTVDH